MSTPTSPDDGRREHWQRVFDDMGEAEVSWYQERPTMSLDLIGRTGADGGAAIVDVGGGASRLVDNLLDAGYANIAVVDITAAGLARARERLAARGHYVRWIVADLRTWTPDVLFDVWHDRAVFHFMVGRDERDAYLTTLRRGVRNGGHVIIATFAANGPEKCSGLPVRRYAPDALADELGSDFRLLESSQEQHTSPGGRIQFFQYSRFRRVA